MKKVLALVLSLMLLVAFTVGCKPAEQPKPEAPAPAPAPEQAAPEKAAPAPEQPAPEKAAPAPEKAKGH